MKLRERFGSDDVQDLIREACERVAQLPYEDLRDPWPSYRDDLVAAARAEAEEKRKRREAQGQ